MATSLHESNTRSQNEKAKFAQPPQSPSPYNNMNVLAPTTAMSAPPTPNYPPPMGVYQNTLNGTTPSPNTSHLSNARPPPPPPDQNSNAHGRSPRPIMQSYNKPSSTRAIMMNTRQSEASYLSPVPQRTKTRRTLVGFDPLLADPSSAVTPSRRASDEILSKFNQKPTLSPNIAPPPLSGGNSKTLSPAPARAKKQHIKGRKTFCTSELGSISRVAAEVEGLNIGSFHSDKDGSNAGSGKGSPVPTETPKTPEKTSPKSRLSILSSKLSPKRESKSSKKKTSEKAKKETNRSSLSPPRGMLPWSKKGHRRTMSLEAKDIKPAAQKQVDDSRRSSVPNTPLSKTDRDSTVNSSFVQELMDIDYKGLEIPSLAKPAPTSFLTGREDEVVRPSQGPAPHQIDIPALSEFVVAARLCEFVDNYRRMDQNFDLQQWVGLDRMGLRQVKIPEHVPIAKSLLDCGDNVCLQGAVAKGSIADERVEAVVFEGQRQFIAVFRGSTDQQSKGIGKAKKKTASLDKEHESLEVYQCFLDEYMKLETECFALLDKLTEEQPFCEVTFTGHSFGAAMSLLAAYRYANARPMVRASCITFGAPRVGVESFKNAVNNLPNLKVMRVEYGQDGKCQLPSTAGFHAGNTLLLRGSIGQGTLEAFKPVLAYQFAAPKYKKFKTTYPDLEGYVIFLREMVRQDFPWVRDFEASGEGVVVNNETRLVV